MTELQLIALVRQHLASILRTLPPETFQRAGQHSSDGRLSVESLLTRITGHIPHHVKTIVEKRVVMGVSHGSPKQ